MSDEESGKAALCGVSSSLTLLYARNAVHTAFLPPHASLTLAFKMLAKVFSEGPKVDTDLTVPILWDDVLLDMDLLTDS